MGSSWHPGAGKHASTSAGVPSSIRTGKARAALGVWACLWLSSGVFTLPGALGGVYSVRRPLVASRLAVFAQYQLALVPALRSVHACAANLPLVACGGLDTRRRTLPVAVRTPQAAPTLGRRGQSVDLAPARRVSPEGGSCPAVRRPPEARASCLATLRRPRCADGPASNQGLSRVPHVHQG